MQTKGGKGGVALEAKNVGHLEIISGCAEGHNYIEGGLAEFGKRLKMAKHAEGQPKNLIFCTVFDQVQIKASVEQSYAIDHKLNPTGTQTFYKPDQNSAFRRITHHPFPDR